MRVPSSRASNDEYVPVVELLQRRAVVWISSAI
jgi:hypothetical protein